MLQYIDNNYCCMIFSHYITLFYNNTISTNNLVNKNIIIEQKQEQEQELEVLIGNNNIDDTLDVLIHNFSQKNNIIEDFEIIESHCSLK